MTVKNEWILAEISSVDRVFKKANVCFENEDMERNQFWSKDETDAEAEQDKNREKWLSKTEMNIKDFETAANSSTGDILDELVHKSCMFSIMKHKIWHAHKCWNGRKPSAEIIDIN